MPDVSSYKAIFVPVFGGLFSPEELITLEQKYSPEELQDALLLSNVYDKLLCDDHYISFITSMDLLHKNVFAYIEVNNSVEYNAICDVLLSRCTMALYAKNNILAYKSISMLGTTIKSLISHGFFTESECLLITDSSDLLADSGLHIDTVPIDAVRSIY